MFCFPKNLAFIALSSILEKFVIWLIKKKNYKSEYNRIQAAAKLASIQGIEVHAGHGLTYQSARVIKKIRFIEEFNIGHFLVGESIFYGLKNVIKKFKRIIK